VLVNRPPEALDAELRALLAEMATAEQKLLAPK